MDNLGRAQDPPKVNCRPRLICQIFENWRRERNHTTDQHLPRNLTIINLKKHHSEALSLMHVNDSRILWIIQVAFPFRTFC